MDTYTRHVLAALLLAVWPAYPAPREVSVAAAANLTDVFQSIGAAFEAASGIHPVFSFASTAQLTGQIENAAPYDVFAAADTEHVDQLNQKGLLTPRTRAVYATGILALWIPPQSSAKVTKPEDLVSPGVKVIAAAKPELAPYGRAAVETMQKLGIWERLKPNMVYAGNISMARQYGTSGNADAVFTALSLVMKEAGTVIRVDERLHRPISQALGILAASPRQAEARQFAAFLLTGRGREILANSGYRVGGGR